MQIDQQVQKVLDLYADGAPLYECVAAVGLANGKFNKYLRANPEVSQQLAEIEQTHGRMCVSKAQGIGNDPSKSGDPKVARVSADVLLRLAGLYDAKYRERAQLDVVHVDITGALTEAKTRALRPMRDLENVIDAQVIEYTGAHALPNTDAKPAPAPNDIFAE